MRKTLLLFAMLALSGCADIDRGLYGLSNQVSTVDNVTGQRSLSLASRQAQIQKSNAQTSQLIQQEYLNKGRPVNGQVDARAYARLQAVFGRVHAVSHLNNEQWKAWLLPDEQWNAFTAGGSEIFVFKGLMDEVSDAELAAIIGHEIAHVTANHVYERQANAMAGLLRGSDRVRQGSYQAAFTLKNEEEADTVGILYAALAGYDPYAAAKLWERQYRNQGDFSASVIDHPVNSARAAAAQALAKRYARYYTPGRVNPGHGQILRQELGGMSLAGNLQPGQGAGFAAALETAAGAYFQHEGAKAEQKAQAANLSFIQQVNAGLSIGGAELVDPHTMRARISYRGKSGVRNLNLVAQAGKEMANFTVPGVVPPTADFVATFRFPKTDLRGVDPKNMRFGVGHAERP